MYNLSRLFWAACLLCLLWFGNTVHAAACTGLPSSYWFVEQWQANPSDLPAGILVENISSGQRIYIRITNNTNSSIRLISQYKARNKKFLGTETPRAPNTFVEILPQNSKVLFYELNEATGLRASNQTSPERPANIAVPTPQVSDIEFLYQDEIYRIPVRLTLVLTSDYKYYPPPDCHSYNTFDMIFTPVGCLLTFIVGLVLLSVLLSHVMKSPQETPSRK